MFVQPIPNFLRDMMDSERQDPQGHTLLLAACRSIVGADAATSGICGLNIIGYDTRIHENPYPQPNNPWREFEAKNSKTCTGPTFSRFPSHMEPIYWQLTIIREMTFACCSSIPIALGQIYHRLSILLLTHLIRKCPSLINQPDRAGLYLLHLAIWRMNSIMLPE